MAPHASMDDGLLDVVLIRAMSLPRLLTQFPKVYSGKHILIKEVNLEQARNIRISSKQRLDIYADGEFMAKLPAVIEINTTKLKVLMPLANQG